MHPDVEVRRDEVSLRRVSTSTGAVENLLEWTATPLTSATYTAEGWLATGDFLAGAALDWRSDRVLHYQIRISGIHSHSRASYPDWKTEGEWSLTGQAGQSGASWTERVDKGDGPPDYVRSASVMAAIHGSQEVICANTEDGSAALLIYDHRTSTARILRTEPNPDFRLGRQDVATFEGWSRVTPSVLWYATRWSQRIDITPDGCSRAQLDGREPAEPCPPTPHCGAATAQTRCGASRLIARELTPEQISRLQASEALFPMLETSGRGIPDGSMTLVRAAITHPGLQVPGHENDSADFVPFATIPVFYAHDRDRIYEVRRIPTGPPTFLNLH